MITPERLTLLSKIDRLTAEIETHYMRARSNLGNVPYMHELNLASSKEEQLALLKRKLFSS